jgi:hypothetical protein
MVIRTLEVRSWPEIAPFSWDPVGALNAREERAVVQELGPEKRQILPY